MMAVVGDNCTLLISKFIVLMCVIYGGAMNRHKRYILLILLVYIDSVLSTDGLNSRLRGTTLVMHT